MRRFTDPSLLGAQCALCPLRYHKDPVPGYGPETAICALIGEGPGKNEVREKVPFVGKSGEILDSLLAFISRTHHIRLDRSTVYIDNATKCFPPNGDLDALIKDSKKKAKAEGLPWVHPVDACRPALFKGLGVPTCKKCKRLKLGPGACACIEGKWDYPNERGKRLKVLVPVGNHALHSLMGVTGIKKWRGSQVPVDTWRQGRLDGMAEVLAEQRGRR